MKNSALNFNKISVCAVLVLLMALALCFAAPQAWATEDPAPIAECEHPNIVWHFNDINQHYGLCECGYNTGWMPCSGSAATCVAPGICSTCKGAYVTNPNAHSWSSWLVDTTARTHSRTCQLDDTHTESASCTDHMVAATCTTAAYCSVCGQSYGEPLGHSLSYARNGDSIEFNCTACSSYSGAAIFDTSAGNSFVYNGSAQTPWSVKYSNELRPIGAEAVLTYKNNVNVNSTEASPSATLSLGGISITKYFTITPAEVNVKADDKTITYGDAAPEFTYTVTGLVSGEEALLTGEPVFSCKYPGEFRNAGSTPIEMTLGTLAINSPNYTLAPKSGLLKIQSRVLQFSWDQTVFDYNEQEQKPLATATNILSGDKAPTLSYSVAANDGPGLTDGKAILPGNYTITITAATDGPLPLQNYTLSGSDVSTTFTINKLPKDAPNSGSFSTKKESIKGIKDGAISGLLDSMEYKLEGDGGYTPVPAGVDKLENLASGSYLVRYAATDTHLASEPVSITVGYEKVLTVTYPAATKGITVSGPTEFDYGADVTVSLALADGYELSTDFAVMQAETKLLSAAGSKTITAAKDDIVLTLSGSAKDTKAPEVMVNLSGTTLAGNCYSAATFTVPATDNDEVKSLWYMESASALSEADLKTATGWKAYTGPVSISGSDRTLYFYAMATDGSDNSSFAAYSSAIVYDTTAPVISGVSSGATYYTTQKIAFADANLHSATLNGSDISSGSSLPGDVSATYTLLVKDKAGNSSTVTVTMKPLSELEAALKKINAKNPTAADLALVGKVQNILDNQCANASSAEIAALQAMLKSVTSTSEIAGAVNLITQLVNALPDVEDIGPENDAIVRRVDNAMRYYNSMSKLAQQLVSDDIKLKLGIAYDFIREYRIVEGVNGVYVLKSNKSLDFKANGVYRKFTWLEIDGKYVEPGVGKYISDSGSTIISLQPVFLETLSEGRHNIVVHYTDGQTYLASFTVASRYSPRTGDTANIPLWGSLMALCLVGAAGAVMYIKKKEN